MIDRDITDIHDLIKFQCFCVGLHALATSNLQISDMKLIQLSKAIGNSLHDCALIITPITNIAEIFDINIPRSTCNLITNHSNSPYINI